MTPPTLLSALLLAFAIPPQTGPIERAYSAPGPSAVSHLVTDGPCDREGNRCDVYYPATDGPAPLITWGNGTDATPSPPRKYAFFLRHLASWGFVVVATRDGATGPGDTVLDAANHVLAASRDPDSPLFHRVDPEAVAAAGHSQGASGAANAMLASDGVVRTAVLFHIPQQAFCNPPESCLRTETLRAARDGAIFYVTGSRDFIISPDRQLWGDKLNSVTAYYEATPLPKTKGVIDGGDHNDLLGRPDCPSGQMGCRQGVEHYLGYPTAWLTWRLGGDEAAGAAFQPDGELSHAPQWKSVRTAP